jgi:hypothetical protein
LRAEIAVAWLRKEDWPRWHAIDRELPPYDQWLAKIDRAISETERKGKVAIKVDIDPEAFVQWCKSNGKKIDRNTRAEYAAAQLMRRFDLH